MKYALISDIHEDVVSLKLALNKIKKLSCDEIICLGDISGFSAPFYNYYDTRDARECLRLIRENCKIVIAGNHDLHSARVTPKINPNFLYPENWYQLDFAEKEEIGKDRVWLYDRNELMPLYTQSDVKYIKELPEYRVVETKTDSIFFSHYIYPNLTGSACGFHSKINDFDNHKEYVKNANCNFSFVGHRHYAGLHIASEKGFVEKSYNRKYTIIPNDCIVVPPITGNHIGNGFCIFDTNNNTLIAKRL